MTWRAEFKKDARKEFLKLGHTTRQKITAYLRDPRKYGQPLSGNLAGLWRYRVGNSGSFAGLRKKH